MSHVRVIVNGETLLDEDLDAWQATPPDAFKDALKPGAKPEPWMTAILVTMADAALRGISVTIEAAHEPGRWALEAVET